MRRVGRKAGGPRAPRWPGRPPTLIRNCGVLRNARSRQPCIAQLSKTAAQKPPGPPFRPEPGAMLELSGSAHGRWATCIRP